MIVFLTLSSERRRLVAEGVQFGEYLSIEDEAKSAYVVFQPADPLGSGNGHDGDPKSRALRVWQENWRVYGADKLWTQLRREARCTVARYSSLPSGWAGGSGCPRPTQI